MTDNPVQRTNDDVDNFIASSEESATLRVINDLIMQAILNVNRPLWREVL